MLSKLVAEGRFSAIAASFNNLAQGLAYLPQKNAVFDDLTVEDNLRLAGHILRDNKEFANRRDEVLTSLPVLATLLKRKPEKMSGGERQMVALGMALLHRPRLLLLDEPTAGLSPSSSDVVAHAVSNWSNKHRLSILLIEHRIMDVPNLVHRYHLQQGAISCKVDMYSGFPKSCAT